MQLIYNGTLKLTLKMELNEYILIKIEKKFIDYWLIVFVIEFVH
jgi:hypothetical protein